MLLLILLSSLYAQTIHIYAPCSKDSILEENLTSGWSLGEQTINALNTSGLPYQGNEFGINQIANSPIGQAAIDFVSSSEMLSYGWCFSINGEIPESYPHEILVQENDQIVWFYGFARYKDGSWVSQCEDSFSQVHTPFCKNLIATPKSTLIQSVK